MQMRMDVDDIRVTDALDVVFDPLFFRKTCEGIHVTADREVSFYSTGCRRIKLEIRRGATTTLLPDIFCRPAKCAFHTMATLIKGDILNLYMDPHVDAHDVYGTVVMLSWIYYTC
jgi:hypothetical protein